MGRGEPSLKIPAPELLQYEDEGLSKIFSKLMTNLIIELMNHKGVCRKAKATPGLFKKYYERKKVLLSKKKRVEVYLKINKSNLQCSVTISISRSELAPGSVFHPHDKSEKNDCDFLGPSWCNIKVDPEMWVPCGSYKPLVS